MASPIPTTLAVILPKIQARVMSVLSFPAERVVIDARTDPDAEEVQPQADQYVRIKVESRTPIDTSVEARGRIYPDMMARVSCTLRSRYDVDTVNSDQLALTAASTGHLVREHQLWDALIVFQPEDASGNWLVREPIKPGPATAPRKPPKEWMQSVLEFSIIFILDLDQSYQ